MTEPEKLALIQTLRRGYCRHQNRVNICAACCAVLEKLVST